VAATVDAVDADIAVRSYRDLRVWQLGMDLAVRSYELSRQLPKDEMFGLVSQIRGSSTSVSANIAEGHGRESTLSFVHFLRVAQGSLKELETHLVLVDRLSLASSSSVAELVERCERLGRVIRSLIRALQRRGKVA
jgi:four helix bundle protein